MSSIEAEAVTTGLRAKISGSFAAPQVPAMSRANYRRELTAACFMPFVLTVFEGSVISVLVRISFEGTVGLSLLNAVTGFIAVVPALANLASFIWVRLSHGSDKIRFITTLQTIMIVLALGMAFVPMNTLGLLTVAALCLLGRTCWSGVATLRSTVWRMNYPDGARAKITGRFAMIQVLLMALLAFGLGRLMDHDPRAFRIMIPIGSALGLIGMLSWKRIRVRGQASLLRDELAGGNANAPSFNPIALASILIEDHKYAAYMGCQFLLGLGNIMAMTLLAIILREVFNADYLRSMLITTVLVFGVMPIAIPIWAHFLDGTHIVRFRALHSWIFVLALSILLAAAHFHIFWLMYIFAILKGIAFGGGVLGWTLGHLDFAPPHKASQYMGVHVTLTGVRGVLAWVIGIPAYQWINAQTDGSGYLIITFCLALTTSGAIGFVIMSRHFAKQGMFVRSIKPEPSPPAQVDR